MLGGCGGNNTTPNVIYNSTPTNQNSSSVSSEVITKPDMDVVDIETQSQIELLCQDDYFKSTSKYWGCLNNELGKVRGVSKPDMDLVDIETQSQIELLCQDDYFKSTNRYWNCLRRELKKIGVTPTEEPVFEPVVVEKKVTPTEEIPVLKSKPDLSGLHKITRVITESHCESYKQWGIQDYWGCLYRQIEESKRISLPDFSNLNEETRGVIYESCEFSLQFGVGSFYGCLNKQIKSIQ